VIRTATDTDKELVQQLWHAFNAEVPDAPWRDGDEDDFAPDLVLLSHDEGVIALSKRGSRVWSSTSSTCGPRRAAAGSAPT